MMEYNPYDNRFVKKPKSDVDAFGHFVSLGTGIITMQLSMMNAGLVFGVFTTVFMGSLMTYCVHILVMSAQKLYLRARVPSLDYGEVATVAFQYGPKRIQKLAHCAGFLVDFFLIISMMGVCSVYHTFAAANIKQIFDYYFKELKIRFYILILIPILILCSQARKLKYLAPFLILANVFIILALGISYYYILEDIPNIHSVPLIAEWFQFPTFFGSIIYNLVYIQYVMPLENNMAHPDHLIGWSGMLNMAMTIQICFYTITGFLSYLKYGNAREGVLSLNLPTDEPLAQSVKLLLAAACLMTYTLKIFIPISILWRRIKCYFPNTEIIAETMLRAAFLLLCVLVAIAIPNIGPLVSLTGAMGFSFTALIFPAIIHLVTFWNEPTQKSLFYVMTALDCFIITFGLVICVTGILVSVLDIKNSYL